MDVNIKAKIEEINDKIANDKNFSEEFSADPAGTVRGFFGEDMTEDDAAIIAECINDRTEESGGSRIVNPNHVGYYYSSSGTSFIHIEATGKITFYCVTVGSYTNMCGITNDNLTISGGQFLVNIPSGSWYYTRNGVKIDGDNELPVQGTYSGSTITISGNKYTKS